MRYGICIMVIIGALLTSCRLETQEAPGTVIGIGGRFLTKDMLTEIVPDGFTGTDSIAFVEAYIRRWVEDVLLYAKAQKNILDDGRIDRMVDTYRRELFIHEYQRQLLNEKLDTEIEEDIIRNYYRTNLEKFVLTTPIIKGLFLKVPETAPQLDDLKKWYRSNDHTSVENIEKYSLHNIVNYEYFDDYWVSFDEVMDNIPYEISDVNGFLQTHKYLEINHDGYFYLLSIRDYLPSGANMPYDFARVQIEEKLYNKQKQEFLQEIRNELYQEAIKEGKIKHYNP